jgi:hypothetical protein
MVRRLCEPDYTPLYASGRLPAMVTLTSPGDWLTVVSLGEVLKRHVKSRPDPRPIGKVYSLPIAGEM